MKQQALTGFEAPKIKRDEDSGNALSVRGDQLEARSINSLVALVLTWARQQHFLYRLSRLQYGVFESQTRFVNASEFNDWLKVGIGWCVWAPGPNGGIVPIAKVMDSRRLPASKPALRVLYQETVDFISSDHATRFLWPEVLPLARASRAAKLLASFA